MGNTATAATMERRVRELIDDLGATPFNTSETVLGWLNDGGCELHLLFATTYEDYLRERFTITTDAREPPEYALPDNLFKCLGVDWVISTTDRRRMEKFSNAERNTRQNGFPDRFLVPSYRLVGSQIEMIPAPGSNYTVELFYVPQFKRLGSGDSVLDKWPYVMEGFELFAVYHAAAEALQREEADARTMLAKKEQKRAEIVEALQPRDAAEPWAVVDVESVREREQWPW